MKVVIALLFCIAAVSAVGDYKQASVAELTENPVFKTVLDKAIKEAHEVNGILSDG